MSATLIDRMLRAAREAQPDLWARTESVARIIDPAAFVDGWVITPESASRLHESKLRFMRANAMTRAQAVLEYLGVNVQADWYAILTKLAEEAP